MSANIISLPRSTHIFWQSIPTRKTTERAEKDGNPIWFVSLEASACLRLQANLAKSIPSGCRSTDCIYQVFANLVRKQPVCIMGMPVRELEIYTTLMQVAQREIANGTGEPLWRSDCTLRVWEWRECENGPQRQLSSFRPLNGPQLSRRHLCAPAEGWTKALIAGVLFSLAGVKHSRRIFITHATCIIKLGFYTTKNVWNFKNFQIIYALKIIVKILVISYVNQMLVKLWKVKKLA